MAQCGPGAQVDSSADGCLTVDGGQTTRGSFRHASVACRTRVRPISDCRGVLLYCESGTAGPLQQAFTWRGNSYSATRGLSMHIRRVICRAAYVHVYTVKNPFTYTFKQAGGRCMRVIQVGSGNRFPGRISEGTGRGRSGAGWPRIRCVISGCVNLDHAGAFADGVVAIGGQVGD